MNESFKVPEHAIPAESVDRPRPEADIEPAGGDDSLARSIALPIGPSLPTLVRAIIFGVAWLPFWCLFTVFFPRFQPIFARLDQRAELPSLTKVVVWFRDLSAASFEMLPLACFAAIVALDVQIASRVVPGRSEKMYWLWFALIVLTAATAAGLVYTAMVAPVFRMVAGVKG